MNREDVIQLAIEAGFEKDGLGDLFIDDYDGACDSELERFANAIEQRTLERAAQACEELEDKAEESRAFRAYADAQKEGNMDYELSRGKHWLTVSLYNAAIKKCAAAIRALGEKA